MDRRAAFFSRHTTGFTTSGTKMPGKACETGVRLGSVTARKGSNTRDVNGTKNAPSSPGWESQSHSRSSSSPDPVLAPWGMSPLSLPQDARVEVRVLRKDSYDVQVSEGRHRGGKEASARRLVATDQETRTRGDHP